MSNQKAALIRDLHDIAATTQILINHLLALDEDKAQEAVTVLLLQGMNQLGPESAAMQQFFPVFDNIKQRLDTSDMQGALGQSRLFHRQVTEIISLVSGA